jgi:hypothetical protein
MDQISIQTNLFPSWITNLLFEQNTIRNECIDLYFPNLPISLNNYELVCVGIRDDTKYIAGLKILSCSSIPLKGSHKIELLPHNDIIEVTSLTHLKKRIFCFDDCLSFERCTFIILHDYQKLIRLKSIRGHIILPTTNNTLSLKYKIANRTYIQANNLIRSIYSSFQRDLHGLHLNDIHEIFLNEISKLIEQLSIELQDKI